jgi:membrane protein
VGVTRAALAEGRGLVAGTGRGLTGRDLAGSAATLTYYAGIAVVAWLLLALWTTSWGTGADAAEERWARLRVLVPPDMGGRPAYDALVAAGTHLGVVGALVVLFPASFYGEGLRRAATALVPDPHPPRLPAWRARALVLVPVVVLPAVAWAMLVVGDLLVPLAPEGGGGGAGDLVVRVVVGFTVLWLALAVLLAWSFRVVLPDPPRTWVAVVGALATGSFLAGFLHGFQLFLSLPVDVGIPYGGLGVAGGVVAVGLWLFVLHTFLLLGWLATRALEERVDQRVARGGGRA